MSTVVPAPPPNYPTRVLDNLEPNMSFLIDDIESRLKSDAYRVYKQSKRLFVVMATSFASRHEWIYAVFASVGKENVEYELKKEIVTMRFLGCTILLVLVYPLAYANHEIFDVHFSVEQGEKPNDTIRLGVANASDASKLVEYLSKFETAQIEHKDGVTKVSNISITRQQVFQFEIRVDDQY